MKLMVWLALFVLCSVMGHAVHAQGSCPAGQMPYSGNDMSSCGPIPPGYQGYAPPAQSVPKWMSQWGAIATDDATGSFGASSQMDSRADAQRAALADCHAKKGATCKLEVTYDNECGAMVVGDNAHNVGADTTLDKVVQLGLKTCHDAGDTNCRVYYSACSMPKRIQ